MAEQLVFEDLLHGILDAAATAQATVERQQSAQLSHFFNDDGSPKTVKVVLPSMDLTAKPGAMTEYEIPVLSITPYSTISIHKMDVKFDVNIESLTDFFEEDESGDHTPDSTSTSPDTKSRATLPVAHIPEAWKETHGLISRLRRAAKKVMGVGLGKKDDSPQTSRAKVRVSFRSNKPPEGFLKLNDELLKRF